MRSILLSIALLLFNTSAALSEFKFVVIKGQTVKHDIKNVYGRAQDGLEMGWSAPGEDPKLVRDKTLMFLLAPSDKFLCGKSDGDREVVYWTWVDADGEESDDQELEFTVSNGGKILRASPLVDTTTVESLETLFDSMQANPAIRFYHNEDCGQTGYSEVLTKGFVPALDAFNAK